MVVPKYLHCSNLAKDLLSIYMLWYCSAHSFAWCWNLDICETRSEILENFWNVEPEKDREDQLDCSCEKWRSITRV